MIKFLTVIILAIAANCYGRGEVPINNGRLDNNFNGNGYSITNLNTIVVSNAPWATPAFVSNTVSSVNSVAYTALTNAATAQATANAAPGVTLTLATNLFVRVIETSPGVWQTKLPGE